MKSIENIERTRRAYHGDAQRNTVHRSSLLAPHLPDTNLDISFVNHFRLKRGLEDVACRLTAVNESGQRVDSQTFQVTEPRVYTFELSKLTTHRVANHLVEFFSPANLFYPFPAVIVNHRNPRFLNSVHSYNRVVNDTFEDDEINAKSVRESSIDVQVDSATDTFAVFSAGPSPCRGKIGVSVAATLRELRREVKVDAPRLTNQILSLRSLFGEELPEGGGVLTLKQPSQFLFYGRMLAGRRCIEDGAIAANHSFYDCSDVEEYWQDGRPSSRIYPLIPGFDARIRQYPIFSPCKLVGAVDFFDPKGRLLRTVDCGSVISPSGCYLEFSVSGAAHTPALRDACSFQFRAWPETGATPRRINHQIIYSDPAGKSALAASIAISLKNPNGFAPPNKKGLTWGQCAVARDLNSRVGIVLDRPDGAVEKVSLTLIGESGPVFEKDFELVAGAALNIDPIELVPSLADSGPERPHYLWYWASCERPDLSAYSVVRHRQSGHCSGEHGF